MEDFQKVIAGLTKEEACAISNKEVSEHCSKLKPTDIDIPVMELALTNSFGNGVRWANLQHQIKEKELKDKYLNQGIWLVLTELASCNEKSLIEDVIRSVGFSYEECCDQMNDSGFNNEILEPIVNSIFLEEEDIDFTEDNEVEFYIEE